MLQMQNTRFVRSGLVKVATGALIPEEGSALQLVVDGADRAVQLSSAGTNVFAGISFQRFSPPGRVNYIRDYVIPAGLSIVLPRTPLGLTSIRVTVNGVAKTVAAGAPASAAAVQLVGNTLTFFAGEATKTAGVTFAYAPSVDEAMTIAGGAPFGGLGVDATGVIGRILGGEVATSCYDPTADWSAALLVELAANGLFTIAGSNPVAGVKIKQTPTAANPFLVLYLDVA